jgi:AcrR family transcriptional regulator
MTATAPVEQLDGRSRRRERNAERLYEAANELLATRSFDELNVEEICAHAGVGRATFFRIFETKAGLLRQFNRRLATDAATRLDAAGELDVRTALGHIRAAVIDAWREAGPGHLGMAREFLRALPNGGPHAAHPELLELVVERVTAGIESGELTAAVPAEMAASLVLLHVVAPVAYAIDGNDVDIDELSTVLLDQWLAGMAVPTPTRRRRSR